MFSWTRNFYAKNDNRIYQFEAKKDRDDAVNRLGFIRVSAKEAYKEYETVHVEHRKYVTNGFFIGDEPKLKKWLNGLELE